MEQLHPALLIVCAAIITYGISTVVSEYSGPFNVFLNLRVSKIGALFECSVCLVPYVAAFPVILLSMGAVEYFVVFGLSVLMTRHL